MSSASSKSFADGWAEALAAAKARNWDKAYEAITQCLYAPDAPAGFAALARSITEDEAAVNDTLDAAAAEAATKLLNGTRVNATPWIWLKVIVRYFALNARRRLATARKRFQTTGNLHATLKDPRGDRGAGPFDVRELDDAERNQMQAAQAQEWSGHLDSVGRLIDEKALPSMHTHVIQETAAYGMEAPDDWIRQWSECIAQLTAPVRTVFDLWVQDEEYGGRDSKQGLIEKIFEYLQRTNHPHKCKVATTVGRRIHAAYAGLKECLDRSKRGNASPNEAPSPPDDVVRPP